MDTEHARRLEDAELDVEEVERLEDAELDAEEAERLEDAELDAEEAERLEDAELDAENAEWRRCLPYDSGRSARASSSARHRGNSKRGRNLGALRLLASCFAGCHTGDSGDKKTWLLLAPLSPI